MTKKTDKTRQNVPSDTSDEAYLLAGIFSMLADAIGDGSDIDYDARAPLEDRLVKLFLASPEAKGQHEEQYCQLVMDFAANYFGATVATLTADELDEIIFDIIPRKVSIESSAAGEIIGETRALFAYLKRVMGLKSADGCLGVLAGDAVERLEDTMSDPNNFGMAKSLIMHGSESGFDMRSKEGLEAFMRSMQGRPLPDSINLPVPTASLKNRAAANSAKKRQRKLARKSRKRNR